VRIDGHDVRALTLASFGRAAGLVIQDKYRFHGALRRNLHPRPDATCEELEAACADAQLHDVIAALPERLDTVVGERGYRLSGGEKQRVAIARHLEKPAGSRPLVIAHRLSTVLAADLIVVLDRGGL
jgi:ATP-binding cassette subfamily B protein